MGDHAAVRLDRHPRLLELAAGALDVQRDAGADEPLAVRGALRLDELSGEVHAALVVAGVVRPAERRLVRELAHEVAAPQLDRVDPQLARRLVDRQLEEGRRLRPPGAAARADRHLVGARAGDGHAGGGDRVAAAHQHRGRVRRRRAVRVQVGAHVGDDPRADREHLTVGVQRELHLGLHAAALVGGEEVLQPVLGPLDRALEPQRRDRDGRDLGARAALRPERAADVGHDDPDRRGVEAQRVGERRQRPLRVLCRHPRGQAAGAVRLSHDAACLHRRGHHARHRVARADDVRGGGERAVDVPARALEPHQLLGRRARIDDRVERLVLDLDQLGRVLGQRARGGQRRAPPAGRRSAPRRRPAAGGRVGVRHARRRLHRERARAREVGRDQDGRRRRARPRQGSAPARAGCARTPRAAGRRARGRRRSAPRRAGSARPRAAARRGRSSSRAEPLA